MSNQWRVSYRMCKPDLRQHAEMMMEKGIDMLEQSLQNLLDFVESLVPHIKEMREKIKEGQLPTVMSCSVFNAGVRKGSECLYNLNAQLVEFSTTLGNLVYLHDALSHELKVYRPSTN